MDYKKQEQPEVDLVAELKHHLATTPKEQLEKEWKELEPWGNIGPTVHEFLYGKPAEWSGEDENIRLDIIAKLESLLEYETQYLANVYLQKDISWLKSLRPQPHWKPSEEQMAVLKNAIHFYGKTVGKEVLQSLYNDLKKQM